MPEQNSDDLIQAKLLTRGIRYQEPASLRTHKRHCLIGLLVLCAVVGALVPFAPEYSQADRIISLPVTLLANALLLMWCLYDGHERGYQIKLPLRILIVLLACIGIPCYLILTRKWRAIVSMILAALFLTVCLLVMFLTALGAYTISGTPLPA